MKTTDYIVLTGPESSGKSFLSRWLSYRFKLPQIPEQSRLILEQTEGVYTEKTIRQIALAHIQKEAEARSPSPTLLDTDLITLKIWSEYRYQTVDPMIVQRIQAYGPERRYLLCAPDIPWEYDELRENPFDRDELFQRYVDELGQLGLSYDVISGDYAERMFSAHRIVSDVLNHQLMPEAVH